MSDRFASTALLLIASAILLVCLLIMQMQPIQRDALMGTASITYRINPNEADVHTLTLLPGIAHGKARRIVEERSANGPFQNVSDLTRVPMIGDKTAAAMSPWVEFGDGQAGTTAKP